MKIKTFLTFWVLTFLLAACTMVPNYKKPKIDVPLQTEDETKPKITKISWQEFFNSPDLQRVIKIALQNNRDLKIANLSIESAQATHGVARSNLLPSINANAAETRQKAAGSFSSFTPKKQFRANLTLTSYEIDFFGRLRSLKKSALEDFLGQEQAAKSVKISLIAETANTYAQLLCDSEILEVLQESLNAQIQRFELIKVRYENGIDSQTDFLNATAAIEISKTNLEIYKKLVTQNKNALLALMASFDAKNLPRDRSLGDIKINENLLNFTPSKSLLSRPDIQEAEHALKSANANIGAARAAFFPTISLTGNYGYGSRELNGLFDSRTWAFTPQISLPIFSGGRNYANLQIANVRKKIEIINYEKAIQNAFREASNGFAQREFAANQLKSFEQILDARQKSQQISNAKRQAGISSKLDEIDSKIAFFAAKQNQLNAKKEYLANAIDLYKILGGGAEIKDFKSSKK